jgi:hypothetical protein
MATFVHKGVGLYRIKMNPLPTFEAIRWVVQGDCKVSFGLDRNETIIGVLKNNSFASQTI